MSDFSDLDTQESDGSNYTFTSANFSNEDIQHSGLFITFFDTDTNDYYTQCVYMRDFLKCLEESCIHTESIHALFFPFTSGWSSHHAYILDGDDSLFDVFSIIMSMMTRRGGYPINDAITPNVDQWEETFSKQIWECEPAYVFVFKY